MIGTRLYCRIGNLKLAPKHSQKIVLSRVSLCGKGKREIKKKTESESSVSCGMTSLFLFQMAFDRKLNHLKMMITKIMQTTNVLNCAVISVRLNIIIIAFFSSDFSLFRAK